MIRSLLRAPGFTVPATAILALGFAAVLSAGEVADGVFLRPLPFAEPERLVTAWQVSGGTRITVDGADSSRLEGAGGRIRADGGGGGGAAELTPVLSRAA
ncbi:MAG TPA: hypothetical protein VMK66_13560 [Myxococcales bacterium]|nr:hypothetical protein [Myxococcales bacterium]